MLNDLRVNTYQIETQLITVEGNESNWKLQKKKNTKEQLFVKTIAPW